MIVVIGTVALDSIETPFGKVEEILGGSALHFASAACYFAPVRLAAVVGEDFPQSSLNFLRDKGVDLSGIKVCPGKTFRWSGRYGYDLNRRETLKTELGVIADSSPEIPARWKNPEHLFLGNIHPKLQGKILEEVGRPGKVSLDTMNLWIESARKDLEKVMARADLVVINEEEAREFSRATSLVKAARVLRSLGPQTVIIKQGEYGALLFHEGEVFSAPGLPLEEVKDPTGAGDSFAGGLIGYLARKGKYDFPTLREAVIVGSAMASFNVEDFGADRLKRLTQEEIQARIAEFRKLSDFGDVKIAWKP